MGRSWQFFLTVAIVCGALGYFYYSSDFYAERSAGGEGSAATESVEAPADATAGAPPEAPAEAGDLGLIPSNE